MIAIRGVYEGKTFKVLPTEPLPEVHGEVPIAMIFLQEVPAEHGARQRLVEVAKRMRGARDAMLLLGMSVKELVGSGRER